MGDHRADIKIKFSMYGETKEANMWINWSPDSSEVPGVDQRVIDFFVQSWKAMYDRYWTDYEVELAQRRKKEADELERLEYERLKAKFEGGG